MRPPSYQHERELLAAGYMPIGVDEAGCGCLAGPVVAAAVHLPLDARIGDIRDSKLLSAASRERLRSAFIARGLRWAIGVATHEEIDRVNIRQATYLAMRRAVARFFDEENPKIETLNPKQHRKSKSGFENLDFGPVSNLEFRTSILPAHWYALVDAWTIPNLPIPQRGIIHGDRLVKSIAAASIIAKVERDRMMDAFDREFPQYGFAIHKGYATAQHRAAIATHGTCGIHRRTFCRS